MKSADDDYLDILRNDATKFRVLTIFPLSESWHMMVAGDTVTDVEVAIISETWKTPITSQSCNVVMPINTTTKCIIH